MFWGRHGIFILYFLLLRNVLPLLNVILNFIFKSARSKLDFLPWLHKRWSYTFLLLSHSLLFFPPVFNDAFNAFLLIFRVFLGGCQLPIFWWIFLCTPKERSTPGTQTCMSFPIISCVSLLESFRKNHCDTQYLCLVVSAEDEMVR